MASVTRVDENGRQGFRIRFYCDKRRRAIYIPGTGRKVETIAKAVAGHVEALSKAKANNVAADPVAIAWANGTDGGLRDNLVEWGLADPASPKLSTDEGRLLGPFVDAYLASRTDWAKKTGENHRQVNNYLKEYFGDRHPIKSITVADAERWHRWLLDKCELSPATVSKHGKRAKMMFASAVNDRLLAVNPFATLKAGKESNSDRHRFISADMTAKVLAACPDADWRLIVTLARYGGLRCPSEVLGLRWADVDRVAGRLRIESPKTGVRFCPIFPEIELALAESDYVAEDGAEYCVARYRGGLSNLRTQFARIVERAGVKAWPKMFVNLRSSRRTELQEQFPDHVINSWLGHSGAVAAKHYLQVTDEHWARAISVGIPKPDDGLTETRGKLNSGVPITDDDEQNSRGKLNSGVPTGVPIGANQGPSMPIMKTKKPRESRGFDGLLCVTDGGLIPPAGVERVPKTREKTGSVDLVYPLVYPSLAIDDPGVVELMTIWMALDDRGREDLLAVARGLSAQRGEVV